MTDQALSYVETHFARFVEELKELLRIPSISTDPAYAAEVRRAAEWLAAHFQALGFPKVEVFETEGHPIVYAEYMAGAARPTVLVYGHYDVQPPDPLELWTSPPFEPEVRDGMLYARGACDDKGQLFMHVKAAEAYLRTAGTLPVNLKFLLEGEEESGSAHLAPFIEAHRELLRADVVVISDTAMFAPGVPSITYGLRGLAYVEVELTGPARDLHSGVYGGAVENPINVLARLIAGLHDENHRITIPGFYDAVRPLTEEERRTFRALPFDEEAWKAEIGVSAVRTEQGYTVLEAITARPTLDVNGIWGGYQGRGAKTVLPARAGAKISMRLVPDQDPEDILEKTRRYFEEHTPPTCQLRFTALHGAQPVLVDTRHPAMQAAAEAMARVFGRRPYFTREGGSIPVVADFKRLLGLDSVLMGFGLNSDAIHSPDEHFGLDRFRQGIDSILHFLHLYGHQPSNS
ncbi:dipeptidase [Rhodothermus profundi]|uniref:Acetylornithine deacetylase/Succinyl-diaminopimelate desuccinylase n=1 Tax=Rhodothermus profundi TaxID=633813 RepID=A0A1M6UTR5_9BACT|nr:dipeptidase [Rhodothermus profundi]SHK72587.1 Acetylornithine deacetylase/Succinyl-diaminopimelate desuccinylase [Rhodothermus profundi]